MTSQERTCEGCGYTGTDFEDDGAGNKVVCPRCNRHDNGIGDLQDKFGRIF